MIAVPPLHMRRLGNVCRKRGWRAGRDLRNSEIDLKFEALEDCVLIIGPHDIHLLYR